LQSKRQLFFKPAVLGQDPYSVYPDTVHQFYSSLVRHSTARVVSAIANIELPLNEWPELFPFLQQACESTTAIHREVGIYVLFSVLESVIEVLKAKASSLYTLFSKLLVDPESTEVRITTVR